MGANDKTFDQPPLPFSHLADFVQEYACFGDSVGCGIFHFDAQKRLPGLGEGYIVLWGGCFCRRYNSVLLGGHGMCSNKLSQR